MLCERCDDERDLATRGKGVYGGGEPRLDMDLRGRTTGGEDGVKRKGWDRKGEGTAVAEEARLRMGVLVPLEEEVRLRKLGVVDGPATGGKVEVFRWSETVVKVRSATGPPRSV